MSYSEDCGNITVNRWVVVPCLNQLSTAESGAAASLVRGESLMQVYDSSLWRALQGSGQETAWLTEPITMQPRSYVTEQSSKEAGSS